MQITNTCRIAMKMSRIQGSSLTVPRTLAAFNELQKLIGNLVVYLLEWARKRVETMNRQIALRMSPKKCSVQKRRGIPCRARP